MNEKKLDKMNEEELEKYMQELKKWNKEKLKKLERILKDYFDVSHKITDFYTPDFSAEEFQKYFPELDKEELKKYEEELEIYEEELEKDNEKNRNFSNFMIICFKIILIIFLKTKRRFIEMKRYFGID